MPNYYDDWRTDDFECAACKWRGPGSNLAQGEVTWDYIERLCPACGEYITLVMNPTNEEARANWEKLSEADRAYIEALECEGAEFERRMLREPSQLPEINSPSFILDWDYSGGDTQIKHGDSIIFAEPAIYEGYDRFIEVAEILRARHGAALRDLGPTVRSKLYLYGDSGSSPETVATARKRIFSNETGNV